MDQNVLIMTVVFAIVFVVLYIADVFKFYALRATLQPLLDGTFPSADRYLAQFGAQLAPVNDVLRAAQTLIDQDTDTLVKTLPPEALASLRLLFNTAIILTDGEINDTGPDIVAAPEVADTSPVVGSLRQ